MIDFISNREEAVRLLRPMLDTGLAISVVAVGEVLEGILTGRTAFAVEQQFSRLLDEMEMLTLDLQTIRIYAAVRADLRATGNLIPDNDLYIAATALRHDLTLVTRNRKHFDRIDDLRIHDAG